ncbi:MAG: ABC transporter substrate-binding protein [Hyphomicrobiales bacterium]|nr:ABC transporter substrate-binding protein [Hyphomicrobiales bacterium]
MRDRHDHSCLGGNCSCEARDGNTSGDEVAGQAVEQALLHGLFPDPIERRTLLRTVGAATVLGAIASILPLDTMKAIAQERRPLEKTKLNVGFLPITCATPLIYGESLGHYAKQGLEVSLQKIAGIGIIRDKMINGELDISQQVMPVALTMTAGLGGNTQSIKVLSILNQNGNSLVLANKHKTNRDPRNWKGFTFAVPFEQSHQAMQLRNYLASFGLDPDQDAKYRVVPPTEYVSSLRVGSIDGFFGGEPGGQRAVYEGAGFIHLISKEIWDGHPCCSVTASEAWIKQHPNTFMAFYRAIIAASLHVSDKKSREGMAKVLAQPQYLNAPEIVVEQVLTGRYADGLGAIKSADNRVDYQPFPHYSAAVWLMVQLRRWNILKEDIDYKKLAQQVMLATDAARIMSELGAQPPKAEFGKEIIVGKEFDSSRPEDYLRAVRKPT